MAKTWYVYDFFWILCKWKVLLQIYRHSYKYYKDVSLGWENKKVRGKIDPTSFQAGF